LFAPVESVGAVPATHFTVAGHVAVRLPLPSYFIEITYSAPLSKLEKAMVSFPAPKVNSTMFPLLKLKVVVPTAPVYVCRSFANCPLNV
jgi:hypothetical protein